MKRTLVGIVGGWLGWMAIGLQMAAAPVTITNAVTGQGIVLGTGAYESGSTVTLRTVPQVDWKFDHWEDVPADRATNNPVTVEASIGLQPRAVFVAANGSGRPDGGGVVAWGWNSFGQLSLPAGLSDITDIATGRYHVVALRRDGRVLAWGSNDYGQTNVPAELSGVVAVAEGEEHSLALLADGRVVAWGRNDYGQASVPPNLAEVRAIAGGGFHSVALMADATVRVWGAGSPERSGDPNYGQAVVPRGLTNVIAIAAGDAHTAVLERDGTVLARGWNKYGQTDVPANLREVVALSAGRGNTVALRKDGTIVAWGWNDYGQSTPLPNLRPAIAVAAGWSHTAVLHADGTVTAWGKSDSGEAIVPGNLKGVIVLAARAYHTLAVTSERLTQFHDTSPVLVLGAGESLRLAPGIANAGSFQWLRDRAVLVGSKVAELRIDAIQESAAGVYQLLAQNDTDAFLSPPTLVGVYSREVEGGGQIVAEQLDATTIRLTAQAASGFKLDHWEGDVAGTGLQQTVTFTEAKPAWRLKAVFVPAQAVAVAPTVEGAGLVLGGGTYDERALVTLRAVPQVDWKFDHWEGLPAELARNNPVTAEAAIGLQPRAVFVAAPGNGRFQRGTVVAWGNNSWDNSFGKATVPADLNGVRAIAASFHLSVALKSDGTVVAWGRNDHGATNVPTGLSGVVAVAAGSDCTVALKGNGTVVAWGDNSFGKATVPAGLSDVMAIAAGGAHTVALTRDGSVVAWGNNSDGQTNVPPGLGGVTAIAAGNGHTVALKGDGSVVAWGRNNYGESTVPTGLSEVMAIAAGHGHTVALKDDGTVVAWGANEYGQTTVPAGLSGVAAISAGWNHTVALKNDGTVVAWGSYDAGQTTVPAGLSGVAAIAAGGYHTVGLQSASLAQFHEPPRAIVRKVGEALQILPGIALATSFQWQHDGAAIDGARLLHYELSAIGENDAGSYQLLAQNDSAALLTTPTLVGVYSTEVAGSGEVLAEELNSTAVRFTAKAGAGFKLDHWEGDVSGTTLQQTVTFTEAKPAWRLKAVFVPAQSVAVAPTVEGNGLVLGGGTYDERALVTLRAVPQVDWKFDHWEGVPEALATNNPVTVEAAIGLQPKAVLVEAAGHGRFQGGTVVAWGWNNDGQATVPADLNGVTAVAAGERHTVSLKSDGTVVAWGLNSSGQTTVPAGLSGVTAIAAGIGSFHTVALKSDGTVVAWGDPSSGQTTVPAGLSGVTRIAAAAMHTVALKSDGTVVAWGNNGYGQTTVPAGLSGVTAIAAGFLHTVALKDDGTVVAWGNNSEGEMTVPAGLSGVTAIAAGQQHTVALKSDGTVVAWGSPGYGQTTVPAGLSEVTAIAAGGFYNVALRSNGTVVVWGDNQFFQTTVPSGLSGVVAISAGQYHPVVLKVGRLEVISEPAPFTVVEVGQVAILAARVGLAARYQWYRDGAALTGETLLRLSLTAASTPGLQTYQLLAENGTEAFLTSTSVVKVVPVGYPRVVVNGQQLLEGLRAGDQAEVTLTTTFPSGQIFYTLDGSVPSLESRPYAGPFTVTNSVVVRALALSGDFTQEATNEPVSIQIVPTYALSTAITGSGRIGRNPALARYLQDDVVTVQAVADAGWRFVRWEDDLSGSFPERNVAMGRDKSVRAVFEATPRYLLRKPIAHFVIPGNADEPAPGTVVRRFPDDFSGELPVWVSFRGRFANGQVTPGAFSYVNDKLPIGWRVSASWPFQQDSGHIGASESSAIRMSDGSFTLGGYPLINEGDTWGGGVFVGSVSVAGNGPNLILPAGGARFLPEPPGIVRFAAGGQVNPPGGSHFFEGETTSLTASAKPGWSFLEWSGDHVGSEPNFTWLVDGPATFEANFGTTMRTLATGPGRVLLEPDLPVYPYGAQVKVIPVPDAGNYLALWGEAGAGQPKTEWVLTVTNATPRVTALFRALASDRVVLSVQSTLGGQVTQPNADGVYAKGSVMTLTAVPESGYEFIGWSGDASGTATEVTLTLATSKTVRAEFRRVGVASFALNVTVAGPGTVRRVPDLGAYEAGSEVELVAEPTGDAVFQGWGGALSSPQRRVRLTVSGPTAVTATFLPVYPVATETRGEGQVLLSPPEGRYAAGTVLALTAKPAEGWGFVQWSGDVTTTGQEATLTVDAPKQVIAEFARLGTLTTKVQGHGSIARTPDVAFYLPGTAVTLTANPVAGWKFVRWTGGATGTGAQLTVTVGRTEAIVAEFADAEGPTVTLTEPVNGTVTDERFALRGTVADNVGVNAVNWSWNGIGQGALSLADGAFAVPGLTLKPGSNLLGVSATDAAGNMTTVNREVMWTPVRTLAVGTAPEVQEGRRLVYPVSLTAPGDVAGLTFRLNYDPDYLTDPQVEWGSLVGQSVNTLNLTTNGQIWAAFSLGGTALPAGTQRVADVSFRARSVPALRSEPLTPVLVSVGALDGATLSPGNAAVAGEGRITPRRITGDINANQRVDIGDAVLLSRLQVGLEELRPWDVALNDLNGSAQVDNGDVIRALRIVVGLDLPPAPSAGMARAGLARAALNTNDTVALEFPDGPAVRAGAPWRVVVRLDRSGGSLSGMSLKVRYPSGLSLAEKRGGALIPGDAPVLWNEEADGVRLAAMRATPWPGSRGEAAVLTFLPGPGPASGGVIEVVAGELSGAGFDVMEMDSVTATVTAENTAPVLGNVADTEVPEHGVLSRQLEATDAEASQTLTYALVSGPVGLTVGGTGAVAWTPTETQGPSTNTVLVQVTDNGVPPLSATNSFTVIVREVNSAPAFVGLTNATVLELMLYAQKLTGGDADVPEQTLSFSLVSGPAGSGVTNGVFGWVPGEADGPSTNEVAVAVSDGVASVTNAFTVIVTEVNVAPVLAAVADRTVEEGTPLSLGLEGSDADVPAQTLTYALVSGPVGLTVGGTGAVAWTPTEAQGPSTNTVVVAVNDGSLTAERTFSVVVHEVNVAPHFVGLTNATVSELVLYVQKLTGGDADVPEQTLSFSLVSGPAGSGVTNGVFGWVPGEAQGPSTNEVTVAVSDGVASVTNAFTVLVTEVNVAPVLAAVADQTVDEGTLLSLSLAGSDTDVPAQTLTYALVSGPEGLTVGGDGAVAWTPTEAQGPSTTTVVVQVNDGSLTAERTFSVVVREVNVAPPVVALPPPGADGKLTLEVTAGPGEEVIVETTTDLTAWTETQRVTGQGGGTPVRVTVTPQAGVEARFWRVRRP